MKKIFNFVKANYFRLLMLIFAAIVATSSIFSAIALWNSANAQERSVNELRRCAHEYHKCAWELEKLGEVLWMTKKGR